MKKLIGSIVCVMLAIGAVSGCASNTAKIDYEAIEAQIEEDIVGSWKSSGADPGYMVFFDNGEVGIFNSATGNGDMMPYSVEGDTITLTLDGEAVQLHSVEVDEYTLQYESEQGNKNVWTAVSEEEVLAVME